MSKQETLGAIRIKLIGPERVIVPGIGLVRPGEIIEMKDELHAQACPRWSDWWEIVKGEAAKSPKPKEESDG